MDKIVNALGLMSGTSMDGIDASLIKSDGEQYLDIIGNLYLKYDLELKNSLESFSNKINSIEDVEKNFQEYKTLERKITIKHSEISSKICKEYNFNPRIVGFHGQTILHKPNENYSIQIGNASLLSQILKKDVIFNFRQNDILHGGDGAPLTPIYHQLLKKKLNIKKPVVFLNIGGIANFTYISNEHFLAKDIGPGNCLMDTYIKKIKKLNYDENGKIASQGKIDLTLINNILDHEYYNSIKKHSFDKKDFDINFVKGLSLEDALANLNYFTAKVISENIMKELKGEFEIILCGGGRKNNTLIKNLENLVNKKIIRIDQFDIDGDYIESQAFGYLSIRSLYKKIISFPSTTKVSNPITGGELVSFS